MSCPLSGWFHSSNISSSYFNIFLLPRRINFRGYTNIYDDSKLRCWWLTKNDSFEDWRAGASGANKLMGDGWDVISLSALITLPSSQIIQNRWGKIPGKLEVYLTRLKMRNMMEILISEYCSPTTLKKIQNIFCIWDFLQRLFVLPYFCELD